MLPVIHAHEWGTYLDADIACFQQSQSHLSFPILITFLSFTLTPAASVQPPSTTCIEWLDIWYTIDAGGSISF